MAMNTKKFLDLQGTGYLWSKIKEKIDAVDTKVTNLDTSLSAVAKSGNASDVKVGTIAGLEATNVQAALAELQGDINSTGTAGVVTVETPDDLGDNAMVYQIKQNGVVKGTINIPKDMFVESGSVVTNPAGQPAGTYIKLVLQNQTDPIFINVANLIEYVTAGSASTDAIQIAIDAQHRVTASVKAGSLTKDMMVDAVKTSLSAADSAVQSITVLGTELRNGEALTAEAAKTALGLKSAAYKEEGYFERAGAAAAVEEKLIGGAGDTSVSNTITGAKKYADGLNTSMNSRVAALEAAVGDDSVATQITTEIEKLDANLSQGAGDDGLALSLTQVNGKVTAISGSIAAGTYDEHGAAQSAYDAIVALSNDEIDTIFVAKA